MSEDLWDGDDLDDAEISVGSKLRPTHNETARDRDERLGLTADGTPKYETLKLHFATSYSIAALEGKSSLTFSTANGAISKTPLHVTNAADFKGALKDMPFNLVKEVKFESLAIGNMRVDNLFAEFPMIKASACHDFGTGAEAAGKPKSVSFSAMPNRANVGGFEIDIAPEVHEHTRNWPGMDSKTIKQSYGKVKNTSWVDFNSPLLEVLSDEQHDLLEADKKTGVYHYAGDHADLDTAASKFEELNDTHVAFSDLNLDKFSFNLTVPPAREYDQALDAHVEKPRTFYDLASGNTKNKISAFKTNKAVSPAAKKQADEALAEFESERVPFSGVVAIKYIKNAPKFEADE
jgi:hypothetical protein